MTAQPSAAAEDRVLRWVRVCAIALVVVGLLFRFSGLGSRVFWWDETHTGRAIAGSFWPEVVEDIYDGQVLTRDEILLHQFPREGRTTVTTMRVLVWEDPRQVPLYFVLARAWVIIFGSSTAILRAFSAVLSIISLPLAFLLGRELFRRSMEGWIIVGLIAVSPMHLVYAQEARQYVLWLDLVLLASWLLLLALKRTQEWGRPAWLCFVLYTCAIGLALITQLLTVLVMAAHLLFVVASERFRLAVAVWLTAAAQFVVALLFLPWALSILAEAQHRAWIPWATTDVPFAHWLRMVVGSYARPFFDIDVGIAGLKFIDQAPVVFVLVVVLIGVFLLVRWAPRQSRLFLLLLGLTCSMPMIVADLFSGGWRTVIIRYQFPVVIAMQLCVAFGIAHLLTSGEGRWRRIGAGTAALLVACGIFSCVLYGRADVWWNKRSASELLAATRYVERCPAPLVVSSESDGHSMGTAMSLAHASSDRTRFLLVVEPEMPVIPHEFEDVFLWSVSDAMLDRFANTGWQVEEVDVPDLHRLSRPSADIAAGSPPSS
jgi:uncharacterized membrane protein